MFAKCRGMLLEEKSGTYVNDDGRAIDYHNARFVDQESNKIFKASLPDGVSQFLPEPYVPCDLVFEVFASERYVKLNFVQVSE